MASEIIGLFTNPQQYLAAQDAAMQQQFAQRANLAPLQKASILAQQAGYRLGQGVGGALGGTDPQLDLISKRNVLLSQLNPNDPASYMKVAQVASQIGDSEFAMAIAQEGRKAQSEINLATQRAREAQLKPVVVDGRVINPNTGQVMYESPPKPEKEEFVVVGNALVSKTTQQPVYQGDKPEKYSAFAQELIDAGLQPGTAPFEKRMLEYVNEKTKGAAKGTGNVIIGGISVDTGEAGKAAAKVIGTNAANIQNQFTLEKTIKGAVDLIDKGIYAGAYGPEQGAITKYSRGAVGDKKKVENTEVFMSYIGETVIPRLQEFGGNDSNEELAYLQKVMGGNLRLEPESMRKILLNAEKKVQANIKRLQKQVEGGQLPTQPMDVPTPSAPKVIKRANLKTGKLEDISGD
jgi:hypothetical protein